MQIDKSVDGLYIYFQHLGLYMYLCFRMHVSILYLVIYKVSFTLVDMIFMRESFNIMQYDKHLICM